MAKEHVDTYSLADAAAEDPRKEGKTFYGYSYKPNNRIWRSWLTDAAWSFLAWSEQHKEKKTEKQTKKQKAFPL